MLIEEQPISSGTTITISFYPHSILVVLVASSYHQHRPHHVISRSACYACTLLATTTTTTTTTTAVATWCIVRHIHSSTAIIASYILRPAAEAAASISLITTTR